MALIAIVFVPFLSVMAFLLGAYFLAAGVKVFMAGEIAAAAFVFVFGLAGVAMSLALWRVRRGLRRSAAGADAPPSGD